jgi:hypothetical protein
VDNIKMDLRKMEWDGLDLSASGYGPVEGSCEHGNEPSGSIKFWVAAQPAASQKRLRSMNE